MANNTDTIQAIKAKRYKNSNIEFALWWAWENAPVDSDEESRIARSACELTELRVIAQERNTLESLNRKFAERNGELILENEKYSNLLADFAVAIRLLEDAKERVKFSAECAEEDTAKEDFDVLNSINEFLKEYESWQIKSV